MTVMLARIQQVMARFSRTRTIYSAGRWREHTSSSFFTEQVVGRDLCLYICIDLRHLPNAKRAAALQYQVNSQSPWPEVSYQVAWQQGYAQVWLWPAALQGMESGVIKHAETVFWPAPSSDGLYLQQCAHGFDLQYWQQACLVASRWYLEQPDFTQQQWFARSQGQQLAQPLIAQRPSVQQQPWPAVRTNPVMVLMQQPSGLLRWGLLLLLLVISMQLTGWWQWQTKAKSYQLQREQLEQQLTTVLEQRTQARTAVAQFEQWLPLLNGIDSLHAQQLVTERLAEVLEFTWVTWSRQHDRVDAVIAADVSSTLELVNVLRGPGIEDVEIEPSTSAGQYRLRLKLVLPLPVNGESAEISAEELK